MIYDLKGLNQNGSYSLRVKYSTITYLGHSRVSVQCRSDPTLDDAVFVLEVSCVTVDEQKQNKKAQ